MNEIPKIPQNENKPFAIKKNNKLSSIEILIDWKEDINIENLFLISKWLLSKKETPINYIYIGAKNDDDRTNLFRIINIRLMKNMNYIDFLDWFENIMADDERYLNSFYYYSLGFSFEKQSKNWINGCIYPIYPWEENFKEHFIPKYLIINKLKKEEERSKKIIKENILLKKKIKKIENLYISKKKK